MGFDKDQTGPIMRPERPDTKSNIYMVIAIGVFLVVTILFVWRIAVSPPQAADEIPIAPDAAVTPDGAPQSPSDRP